jgi:radical SAM protein with 4Fe4S-binding SPASM domain
VRFTGGEPLLRDDFSGIYTAARRLGLRVSLLTNATLITPEIAWLLASIPPLEPIEITVYGMERDSCEAVTRTPGSFEAAWQGMNMLLQEKVPFIVKGAVLPPNRLEVERFEQWASTIPWMDRPPLYSLLFDLRARRDSMEKNRHIRALRISPEDLIEFLSRRREEYLKEMGEFCSRFTQPPGSGLFPCSAGVGGACMDAYGTLQLCLLLRHPDTVYDLKGSSLRHAIEEFFPQVRKFTARNHEYLRRCARCFLHGLCEQCPAQSWMEHGARDTPVEYLCEITHAQARDVGLLGEGEMGWEVKDWKERIRRFSESGSIGQECASRKSASR